MDSSEMYKSRQKTDLVDSAPIDDESIGDDQVHRFGIWSTCCLSHALANDLACEMEGSAELANSSATGLTSAELELISVDSLVIFHLDP